MTDTNALNINRADAADGVERDGGYLKATPSVMPSCGTSETGTGLRHPPAHAQHHDVDLQHTTRLAAPVRSAAKRVTTPVLQATSRMRSPGRTLAGSISFAARGANMAAESCRS
jgi:hypothetical protein